MNFTAVRSDEALTMLGSAIHSESSDTTTAIGRLPRVWMAITFASLGAGFALTFDPSFADVRSTVITLLPFVLLPTIAVAFLRLPVDGPSTALTVAALASVAGWTVLVLDDERWVALTFALYGLAFSIRGVVGLATAGAITMIWMVAWIVDDGPAWRLPIPLAALVVGVVGWVTFVRAHDEQTELARLLDELRETQADLATSEREKGVLEERARVAGEIHDTLAQGFTSIVVLARSGIRTGSPESSLHEIESVASDNLQAARRLVSAMGPAELDSVSLPDAIERHLSGAIDDPGAVHFEVIGPPRPLGGVVEVALFRAVQETVLNVRRHTDSSEVHVTLAYLVDRVALDVVDDGGGFEPGVTADRGDLTGGQGLAAIRQRVRAVGGRVEVESTLGEGTAVSVQIPTGAA